MIFPRIAFFAATVLAAAGADAQVELLLDPANQAGPVLVRSGKAVFERETGVTSFTGGVTVTHAGLQLTCEEAVVQTADADIGEIEFIRVGKNVVMTSETGEATADWGIYFVPEARIELHGGVRVKTQAFTLTGPEFHYDLRTGKGTLEKGSAADIRIADE